MVPYTVRPENQFLPLQYRTGAGLATYDATAYGNVFAEYRDLFAAGVDALFTDSPDLAFAAREDLQFTYSVEHPQAAAARQQAAAAPAA